MLLIRNDDLNEFLLEKSKAYQQELLATTFMFEDETKIYFPIHLSLAHQQNPVFRSKPNFYHIFQTEQPQ